MPPGLSAPGAESNRLNRSKSNAGSKSQDLFSKLPEDNDEKEEKLSLLDRIFPRKSSRKKKKGDKEFKNEGVVKESKEKGKKNALTACRVVKNVMGCYNCLVIIVFICVSVFHCVLLC